MGAGGAENVLFSLWLAFAIGSQRNKVANEFQEIDRHFFCAGHYCVPVGRGGEGSRKQVSLGNCHYLTQMGEVYKTEWPWLA